MSRLSKTQLIRTLSDKTDLTQTQVKAVIDGFLDEVTQTTLNGDEVTLIGFGTFKRVQTKERQGVKPGTGETITIPASTRLAFKAAKANRR